MHQFIGGWDVSLTVIETGVTWFLLLIAITIEVDQIGKMVNV